MSGNQFLWNIVSLLLIVAAPNLSVAAQSLFDGMCNDYDQSCFVFTTGIPVGGKAFWGGVILLNQKYDFSPKNSDGEDFRLLVDPNSKEVFVYDNVNKRRMMTLGQIKAPADSLGSGSWKFSFSTGLKNESAQKYLETFDICVSTQQVTNGTDKVELESLSRCK